MEFSIKNIGKINSAKIEIKKISVIAGENNSGKSTIGKSLFSVFNSLTNFSDKIFNAIFSDIRMAFESEYSREYGFDELEYSMDSSEIDLSSILTSVVKKVFTPIVRKQRESIDDEIIRNVNKEFLSKVNEIVELKPLSEMTNKILLIKINDILKISQKDVLNRLVSDDLRMELNNQITNVYSKNDSEIILKIKDNTMFINIEKNTVVEIKSPFELSSPSIYIDDPFILDDIRFSPWFFRGQANDHRNFLISSLEKKEKVNVIESIRIDSKLNPIFEKLNKVVSGELIRSGIQGVMYEEKGREGLLNVKNLSSGLKTFVILKTLISNGTLKENGTLILDEPEVHLHPEWQLVLAEIIVLIQKAFDMHILITTHSPYFLRAIEVFSIKSNINNECKYYSINSNFESIEFKDKTDDIDAIYEQLAQPFQDLENILYED